MIIPSIWKIYPPWNYITAKARENGWLEDESTFGMSCFQGRTVSFRGVTRTFVGTRITRSFCAHFFSQWCFFEFNLPKTSSFKISTVLQPFKPPKVRRSHEETPLLSMESWLLNKDPYYMRYCHPHKNCVGFHIFHPLQTLRATRDLKFHCSFWNLKFGGFDVIHVRPKKVTPENSWLIEITEEAPMNLEVVYPNFLKQTFFLSEERSLVLVKRWDCPKLAVLSRMKVECRGWWKHSGLKFYIEV